MATLDRTPIWNCNWIKDMSFFHLIQATLILLYDNGCLGYLPPNFATFESWYDRINQTYVDRTSITPAMALLLFSLGFTHKPRGLVVICGCYQGLAMNFILAGLIAKTAHKDFPRVVALDIDGAAIERAHANSQSLGLSFVEFFHDDARSWCAKNSESISLLYLDLDDPYRGKADYVTIFNLVRSEISPGGLLLAHDSESPVFTKDLDALKTLIVQSQVFSHINSFPVDQAGLLVAIKSTSADPLLRCPRSLPNHLNLSPVSQRLPHAE